MSEMKKHSTQRWEVSLIAFKENGNKKYKVTRRLPDMSVAETKFFETEEEAKKQFDEWSR